MRIELPLMRTAAFTRPFLASRLPRVCQGIGEPLETTAAAPVDQAIEVHVEGLHQVGSHAQGLAGRPLGTLSER